ncbi:MAG: glycoside hydrolase family 15 protein [Candidatus Palauibacterales bacterium]|nr:glycoside hydrolase family 15 protein [Candidatus Palauibacterales bacterium]MDP2582870.1 glycoside hydrolase family 15 protein [Candidatus Palauibacterales bacterium]
MADLKHSKPAHGAPGIEPRWTRSAKEGVGTAYAASSRVWFTVSAGILNEIYFPTIDQPQVRDLQYLVTDGRSFFHDERRHTETRMESLDGHSLGYRIVNRDPEGRYRIVKELFSDPHAPCVLTRTWFEPIGALEGEARLYALLAPHLAVGGRDNSANVARAAGRIILTAHRGEMWLALGATAPFLATSCGYVGASDGWTDLSDDMDMEWEYDSAPHGNVALTGQIEYAPGEPFTLGLAFGDSLQAAVTVLLESLAMPVDEQRDRFQDQWSRACGDMVSLAGASGDDGRLYERSHSLLLAHEDKTYPGALIASLSIPWGDYRSDEDLGGYHLVWTRDMVNSAMALLASGNVATPLRALVYLAGVQRPDGGFHQNFWLDGTAYWKGVQLDETAFPILLAWRLDTLDALQGFDPYPMVLDAAAYLVRHGPVTPQDRWEEVAGYSPSTLASNIAALTCASCMARERGDASTADFLEAYADFLHCHVTRWTVTERGSLLPDVPRHFVRVNPADPADPHPSESPDGRTVTIANRPPGTPFRFPAEKVVDAGFLELVRYGIFPAGDPLFEDSLRVVDAVLRVGTPFGPCWRRYNHDGYGQRDDGGPYLDWGRGRAWPLLSGERGHYELAAGRDPGPYIQTLEGFASTTGLLPEQVWDDDDLPGAFLYRGCPTGSAMPLMWAHGEYVKLLRSAADGEVFDVIPAVRDRYVERRDCRPLEVWKFNRQPRTIPAGWELRVVAAGPFRLRWSDDGWATVRDTDATATALGLHYVDLPGRRADGAPLTFTFHWTEVDRWEGRDFEVEVVDPP